MNRCTKLEAISILLGAICFSVFLLFIGFTIAGKSLPQTIPMWFENAVKEWWVKICSFGGISGITLAYKSKKDINIYKYLLCIALITIVILSLAFSVAFGITYFANKTTISNQTSTEYQVSKASLKDQSNNTEGNTTQQKTNSSNTKDAYVSKSTIKKKNMIDISSMNDEELEKYCGQIFMVGFEGAGENQAARLISDYGIGGIIIYAPNIDSSSTTKISSFLQLTKTLQKRSITHYKLPLFIAADMEGGNTAPLTKGKLVTAVPAPMALAATRNLDCVRQASLILSREMSDLGVNMNLSPVLDVSVSGEDSVITDRSFGGDLGLVNAFGETVLTTFRNNNVISVVKHFPGHGGTKAGFETAGLPESCYNSKSLKNAIKPFRELVNKKLVDAVMTSHFKAKAIGEGNVTFNPKVVKGLLRSRKIIPFDSGSIEGIGFAGVVIADNLNAPSITSDKNHCQENISCYEERLYQNAIHAFDAGHDILMFAHIRLNNTKEPLIKRRSDTDCWRWAMKESEFINLFSKVRQYIFHDLDTSKKVKRIQQFRESLTRIIKLKQKLKDKRVANEELFLKNKLANKHEDYKQILFTKTFTVIKPARGCSNLANVSNNDKIFVLCPSRFATYKGIEAAKKDSDWPNRLLNNVKDYDWTNGFRETFKNKAKIIFELEKQIPGNPEEMFDRAQTLCQRIKECNADYVVVIITRRGHWLLAQYIASKLASSNFKLGKIHIIVTIHPGILKAKANIKNIESICSSLNYYIAYSGYGYRVAPFYNQLISQTGFNSEAELSLMIPFISPTPDFTVKNNPINLK